MKDTLSINFLYSGEISSVEIILETLENLVKDIVIVLKSSFYLQPLHVMVLQIFI